MMIQKTITFLIFSLIFLGVHAQSKKNRGNILYVLRMEYRDRPIDEKVKAHLDSLGYKVTFADQSAEVPKAHAYDLIIISSTVGSQDFEGKYKDMETPILSWENDILDDLRFTGRNKDVDFGEVTKEHYIWIVNAPHPLAAGLPAGINSVYRKDQPMGWGKPGLGASIIATIPGQPDKAIIFGYEKGATMDYNFLAPARRVAFFLDNTTFPLLKENGLKLFDAAVNWAIAK
ncbi:hypothetical protein AQ505_20245 [Pedobacter sp. PACM 27299]|uniref:hypothetical protein n=1 Tax=Pedobacter sp. PACM 27299 TaxID=1727164 RepID=UPI000706428E|nr:hypothetical protein [Pedobacter sp. PACM 27299]ALL07614.1 hypothetical protein AQ505_20245 [Pedobacter sp. PACM 27299]